MYEYITLIIHTHPYNTWVYYTYPTYPQTEDKLFLNTLSRLTLRHASWDKTTSTHVLLVDRLIFHLGILTIT